MTPRRLGLRVALFVLMLDQITKWFVIYRLQLPMQDSVEILPIFRLIWVENRGVSMGFLTANGDLGRWLLAAGTGLIAIGVGVWLWREKRRPDAVALGLVLAGALGNILDRVRLGFVADFLNLHFGAWSPFLVFNVADAAISIGVALLVFRAIFTRDTPPPSENVNGEA